MNRVVIMVAPGTGFGPGAVAAAWNGDAEGLAAGTAVVEAATGEVFFPGLVELVVVPMAVNMASTVIYELVKKLAARLRAPEGEQPKVEQPEISLGSEDIIIVIRGGRGPQ